MGEIKKIKLIGLGNENRRNYFKFSKNEIEQFFYIFPIFLEKLNLQKTSFFYEEAHPIMSIGSEKHKIDKKYSGVEHTENNQYDVDIIFLPETIEVIIRTDEASRSELIDEIKKIADYSGFD
ncbi:hypothetical protein CEE44_04055 [Candidatus Woesearchaeota archaeon B3_Woes]|nr:MAG: hypothetical protein CEE44_04055 [Candidatus Woesearchaeota archaeon B3_Woes]